MKSIRDKMTERRDNAERWLDLLTVAGHICEPGFDPASDDGQAELTRLRNIVFGIKGSGPVPMIDLGSEERQ